MEPTGYTPPAGVNLWLGQLAHNSQMNGRTIIPEDVYRNKYIGDMPVGLLGYGEVYVDGA
jgi:hypothetical protein